MWEEPTKYCEGWNFGPHTESIVSVWDVKKSSSRVWKGNLEDISSPDALHEAKLDVDITKAVFIKLETKMNINQCIALTIDWYKRYKNESAMAYVVIISISS